MLGRLVAKLLFKACLPLVAVAGVISYGVYMKGGDPAKWWGGVGSEALAKASGMFSSAGDGITGLTNQLFDDVRKVGAMRGESALTEVFTWKDADGVTHFGTQAPSGISAQTIRVDPDTNVLAPVAAPVRGSSSEFGKSLFGKYEKPSELRTGASRDSADERTNKMVQELQAKHGELPGIAGQVLSSGASGEGGIDASQLIRLLQSAAD